MNSENTFRIEDIREAIEADRVRISDHAKNEAKEDSLLLSEIFYSVCKTGAIIEHYPKDTPSPSCLVHGVTQSRQNVHSVWAFDTALKRAILITVYTPDPQRWIDFRKRRTK